MVNEYGAELDRNGYAPSILNRNVIRSCHLCLKSTADLQRHEVFHGAGGHVHLRVAPAYQPGDLIDPAHQFSAEQAVGVKDSGRATYDTVCFDL